MNCGAVAGRASPRRGLPSTGRHCAFQESTRPTCSGLPTPSRRTFASALPASALCMSASLRHPGCARSHSPLEGMGSPSPRLLIKTRRSHTFRRRVNSGSLTKPLDRPGHGFLAGLRPLVLTRASCPGAGPLTPSADACTRDLSRSRWTILATASWRDSARWCSLGHHALIPGRSHLPKTCELGIFHEAAGPSWPRLLGGLRPLVLFRASGPGAGPLTPSADACTRPLSPW
jgi:hypothetical protein